MVKIEITNLEEFERELQKKLQPLIGLSLEKNIRSIAHTDAFDTGAFHNSITYNPEESAAEGAAVVQDGVGYGWFLEWGTIYIPPRAIFQRGLNLTLKDMPEILARLK